MSETDLKIRHASSEDVETLAALGASTFRDAYGDKTDAAEMEDYVVANFTPDCLAAQLADESSMFLLAHVGEQPVGYAKLSVGLAPECVRGASPVELSRLYLDPRVIGRGHGAALMRACLAEAERLGAETMWLGVWERNERARRFYFKWGFRDVGTHEFVFGGKSYNDPVMVRPVKDGGRPRLEAEEA